MFTFDREGNTVITAAGQLDPADCCMALERVKYQIVTNEGGFLMSDPVTTAVESVSWWTQIWDARDAILGGALAVVTLCNYSRWN